MLYRTRPATVRSAALLLAFPALLAVSAPPLPADRPPEGWAPLEGRLRSALAEDRTGAARGAVAELLATEEPRGVEIAIRYALRGRRWEVFSHTAGQLAELPPGRLREPVFEALESSPNHRTKIILLAVVKRWTDDPEALEALHGRLSDRRKAVVFTALRWIRELDRPRVSLPHLIDELERRERRPQGRVHQDILKTLRALTGVELRVAADWRNYWRVLEENPDASPPKPREGRTRLAAPSFFSVAVDSDRVLFLIDVSSSMEVEDPVPSGPEEPREVGDGTTVVRLPRPEGEDEDAPPKTRSRISAVRDELARTVEGLSRSVRFNIYAFNHEVEAFDPSATGGLLPATPQNKARAVRWVRALRPGGATRTDQVLRKALGVAQVDTIYLLTDGAPKTVRNEKIPHEQVFGVVRGANLFRKCRINTIGFLQAGSSMQRFVKELARQNDGRCILLE